MGHDVLSVGSVPPPVPARMRVAGKRGVHDVGVLGMGVDERGGERARQRYRSALRAEHVEDTAEQFASETLAPELRKHGGGEQGDPVAGLGVQKSGDGAVVDAQLVDRRVFIEVMLACPVRESAV